MGKFLSQMDSAPSTWVSHEEWDKWLSDITRASPTAALGLGIVLTVVGSCFMALGSVLMKIGIHREAKRLQRDVRMPLRSHIWWIGLGVYSIGAALHMIALAFAPASVLAPLNSLGLVANSFAAVVFLNESLSMMESIWTFLTMAGVSLCASVSFFPSDDALYMVDGTQSWTDGYYIVYLVLSVALTCLSLIFITQGEAKVADERFEFAYKQHLADGHVELTDLAKSLATGVRKGDADLEWRANLLKEILDERKKAHDAIAAPGGYPVYISLLYSILSGIVGAQCVLQFKEVGAFLKMAVEKPNVWLWIQPYIVALFGVASIVAQMHFLNLGLARGDATIVIPTYYVSWTVVGAFGGFAKFHEGFGFSALQIIVFIFGLGVTSVSVALLASGEINRVRDDAQLQAPLGVAVDRETAQRPMRIGVPLGMGLAIISVGRLAGRVSTLPRDVSTIRRTQSFCDFSPRNNDQAIQKPDDLGWFNWTVAGGIPPHYRERMDTNDTYQRVPTQNYYPQSHSQMPSSSVSKSKHKTLDEIYFGPESPEEISQFLLQPESRM